MDIKKIICHEEDMFPKYITNYQIEDFGILFFNENNKTSYDSNHAVIYRDKVKDLGRVLERVTSFYKGKDIHPSIYQATGDQEYFTSQEAIFMANGYRIWTETPSNFMVLSADNQLKIVGNLKIKLLDEWDHRIASDICIPANEAYEIEVFKQSIKNQSNKVFVAFEDDEAAVVLHMHISEACCRFNYILTAPKHRGKGFARALLSHVVDYCCENEIINCYQWPAHKTSEKLCYEAGFRHLFTSEVARASYISD